MSDSTTQTNGNAGGRGGLRFLLSFVLMVVIFAVLLHAVSVRELADAFARLRVGWFGLVVGLHVLVVMFFSPLVWRYILDRLGCRLSLRTTYDVWLGMFCLRPLLPMKSGGVVGANYLNVHRGLPLSRGIGSLLLTHFLNFYALWVYLTIGLWWTGVAGYWVPLLLTPILLAVPIALPWMGALARLGAWVHPKIGSVVGNLVGGFTEIPLRSRLALFAVVLTAQVIDTLVVGAGLLGAGIAVPIRELFLRVPAVYLVANLPLTLGGFGTREATMMHVFRDFGTQPAILAAGIALSFCMEIVPAALSLIFLPRAISMGLFQLRRKTDDAGAAAGDPGREIE